MVIKDTSRGLTYGQVFVLIAGFLVTSAFIFLLGLWVGQDLARRGLSEDEHLVRLPVPTASGAASAISEEDVDRSFYENLKDKAMERLRQTATPGSEAPATPTSVVPPTATPRPSATRAPSATPRWTATAVPTAPAASPSAAAASGEEWADAGWTVQAFATTKSEQAIEVTLRLRSKGFDAYTVQVPLRGETWYRVRVGRFAGRAEASVLADRLKREEGLSNAFVTPR